MQRAQNPVTQVITCKDTQESFDFLSKLVEDDAKAKGLTIISDFRGPPPPGSRSTTYSIPGTTRLRMRITYLPLSFVWILDFVDSKGERVVTETGLRVVDVTGYAGEGGGAELAELNRIGTYSVAADKQSDMYTLHPARYYRLFWKNGSRTPVKTIRFLATLEDPSKHDVIVD